MKKFLIGLITGLVLAGLAGVIFVFSLVRFSERRPSVSDGSTLIVRLAGEVPEEGACLHPGTIPGHTDTSDRSRNLAQPSEGARR